MLNTVTLLKFATKYIQPLVSVIEIPFISVPMPLTIEEKPSR